jgi:spermidine dehydrogenase
MTDRELGMNRRISRRDFLNGVALGTAGSLALPAWVRAWAAAEAIQREAPYPPALMGMRGSHDGSFEAFHQLRDDRFWSSAPRVTATTEAYDLVVVGGGLSGLAAAYFYRQAAGSSARILILDNHDDFGGHAKRNEFTHNGRTFITYGGTQSIDSPRPYSAEAKRLVTDLGVDVSRYAQVLDDRLYPSLGLQGGYFFDRETWGADKLVVGNHRRPDAAFLADAPMSDAVRRDLTRLYGETFDPWPGVSSADKKLRLARMSYADFLLEEWRLDPGVVSFFRARTHGLFGVGIEAVPAQDAWGLSFPGFQGLGLDEAPGRGQNYDSQHHPDAATYYFHFPDGNASLARLLVRALVPAAIPGRTADDIVTARADYGKLDATDAPVRIRLASTVMRVRHDGAPDTARHVEVTYLKDGKLHGVTGKACVLACWHSVIPHICEEVPEAQKQAMLYGVKVPLVYTRVFVRDWTAFRKLGVSGVATPGLYHTSVNLDFPVSLGDYQCSRRPEDPIVVNMSKVPGRPGLPTRVQHRAGRVELLSTTFETFEREIRGQLGRVLGAGGFDPARDILGITVNRWPHGYAYQYNSLYDPFWLEGGEEPCAVARRPFGRIAIANSDAAAYAYTDAAFDHAHRAVGELLAAPSRPSA